MFTPTILIIDDEPSLLEILHRTLKDIGDVVTASSVYEARGIMSHLKVDICLCDYQIGETETMLDMFAITPPGVKFIGMSGLPRHECRLPDCRREMPWVEKGGGNWTKDAWLTVMEAMNYV